MTSIIPELFPVPEFPGYFASRDGRVWSKKRKDGIPRQLAVRPKAPSGHLVTILSRNGKGHPYYVHHIMLWTFVGPRPQGMESRHLDGNCLNNTVENLKWDTRSENTKDRMRHFGYIPGGFHRGEKNHNSVITEDQVRYIRQLHSTGKSQSYIARLLRVQIDVIRGVVNGRTWSHVT